MSYNSGLHEGETHFTIRKTYNTPPQTDASTFTRGLAVAHDPAFADLTPRLSQGTASEMFLGFSLSYVSSFAAGAPAAWNNDGKAVQVLGQGVPISLDHEPLSETEIQMFDLTANAVIPAAADIDNLGTAAEGSWVRDATTSNQNLTIKDTGANVVNNHLVVVYYRYAPTVAEFLARVGEQPLTLSTSSLNQVTVGFGGDSQVYTNMYTLADGGFAIGGNVRLAAGGLVSAGGAGTIIGVCTSTPTPSNPAVGFRLA